METERAYADVLGAIDDVLSAPKGQRISIKNKLDLFTKLYNSDPGADQDELLKAIAGSQCLSLLKIKKEYAEFKESLDTDHEGNTLAPAPIRFKKVGSRARDCNETITIEPLKTENAVELMARTFEPIRWIAQPILCEGLAVLAGAPKSGKSAMALSLAVSVATGGQFMGQYTCTPGRVLFLGLEDGARRLQARIEKLTPAKVKGQKLKIPNLELLETCTNIQKSENGGIELLQRWLTDHPDTRLIVIDTLARFRSDPGRNGGYMADTSFMEPLQEMAIANHCCLLLLHHTRKMAAADPLESISGTLGIAGVADAVWVLRRESRFSCEAVLAVMGRDFDELELAVKLNKEILTWEYVGLAWQIKKTKERETIVEMLADVELAGALGPAVIAKVMKKDHSNISRQIKILMKESLIYCDGSGKYYGKTPDKNEPSI